MTTLSIHRKFFTALSLLAVLALSACDNVGRAFDPDRNGGGGEETEIQGIAAGGIVVAGRPKVTNVFPDGNGWPGTVPIVVVFNETVSPVSIAPSSGTPTLFVRLRDAGGGLGGAATPLPASYDFFLGGRAVVIRPTVPFDTTAANTYEIVISPDARDVDGIRFGGSEERVLGSFTADRSDTLADAEILTTLPINNARDVLRSETLVAVFTRPAEATSVNPTGVENFALRPAGGVNLVGMTDFPLNIGGQGGAPDTRVVEFTPQDQLAGAVGYEVVVADTITFPGGGKLDFRGRTPFARFDTVAVAPATSVTVRNASPGAADKINRRNLDVLSLDVEVPADTVAGDQIVARIYGLDKDGGTTQSLSFVEANAPVPANGAQTVPVGFAGRLGNLEFPQFLEGPLLFAANIVRGSRPSGFVLSATATNPALDITAPTVATPAADANGDRVLVTDQEQLVVFGTGSEDLSGASLLIDGIAVGMTSGTVFGTGSGGRYMFEPVQLGRRTGPATFSLTVTDSAGNESPAVTGTIVQRGVVTGSVAGGALVVEAYDDATLAPLAGATVVIEEGLPTSPSTGRRIATTGADGKASFSGLTAISHSITLVRDGYDLISILDVRAGYVSLPMRPLSSATATVRGTAVFTAGAGQSVLAGCNILDDITAETIASETSAPTTIPGAAARPNRPYVLTAMGGTFEPTGVPAFAVFGCSICGITGLTREAALAPLEPGATGNTTLALLPAAATSRSLVSAFNLDLGTWTGLDAAMLSGTPTVRVMASLFGMPQMTAVGAGAATQSGSTSTYGVQATYSLSALGVFEKLLPKFWVSLQAEDVAGNLARLRTILVDPLQGATFPSGAVPAVNTITPPAGPSADSPAVTFQDRLDSVTIPDTYGFVTLTATNGSRSWRVIVEDQDGAMGTKTIQLPLFTGVPTTGLSAGSWRVRAEAQLMFSLTMGNHDYLLEERRREEVSYARTGETVFVVN